MRQKRTYDIKSSNSQKYPLAATGGDALTEPSDCFKAHSSAEECSSYSSYSVQKGNLDFLHLPGPETLFDYAIFICKACVILPVVLLNTHFSPKLCCPELILRHGVAAGHHRGSNSEDL